MLCFELVEKYDAAVCRFWTQDNYSEKYAWMSPYQYAGNSPVMNIDVNGDSVNVSDLQTSSPAVLATLCADLEAKTGLDISVNVNGNLNYATEKGFLGIKKAKVARNSDGKKIGSRLARKALKRAIKR